MPFSSIGEVLFPTGVPVDVELLQVGPGPARSLEVDLIGPLFFQLLQGCFLVVLLGEVPPGIEPE
eukprot:1818070-Pyramimonas_sp.AAC.1